MTDPRERSAITAAPRLVALVLACFACLSCDALHCGRGSGPPTKASAEPAPPPLPPPLVRRRLVGTPHSILIEAVDPGGRWVIACQPRADSNGDGKTAVTLGTHGELWGDGAHPWLVFDRPEGERIDVFIAHSASGRHLVVIEDGKLVLIDTSTRQRLELDADLRDDDAPHLEHRAAVFDPLGEYVAYARVSDGKERIVLRTLSSGHEQEVDPGPGMLWRFEVAAGGKSVLARVVDTDHDQDGKLGWPVQDTSIADRGCRGAGNYTFSGYSGDYTTDRVIEVSSGKTTALRNVIEALGEDWLASDKPQRDKDAQRTLSRVTRDGTAHELVPASCGGRTRYLDHTRGLALFECEVDAQSRGPFTFVRLELHGKNANVRLPYRLNRSAEIRPAPGTARFVVVRGVEPDGAMVLDLDQPGRVIREGLGAWPMAVHGTRVLTRGEGAYVIRDLVSGSERVVTRDMPAGANGPPYQTERFAWIPPFLIDLESERVVGTTDALVVAVSRAGQVLHFPAGQPKPESRALRTGPLAWSGEETR